MICMSFSDENLKPCHKNSGQFVLCCVEYCIIRKAVAIFPPYYVEAVFSTQCVVRRSSVFPYSLNDKVKCTNF